MDLGRKFKFYRVKTGLTQKEAAELIGIKDYQLGNYETNRSEPSIPILKKMSKIYQVSIDKMVGNNWKDKTLEPIVDADGYVDIDELSRRLNEMAEELKKNGKW